MLSAPTSTAPAASMRSIRVASRVAGGRSRLIFEPARVGSPSTSNRFFTAKGTPASGPTLCPAAMAVSMARALARARSAVTSVKELRTPSCLAIRASAASIASAADMVRPVTALAMSAALSMGSGTEDTRGLGLVGQVEFIDQPRQLQRHVEIGLHRRLPGVLDRKPQGLGEGIDIVVQRISHPTKPRSVHRQRRMRNRRQQFLGIGVL